MKGQGFRHFGTMMKCLYGGVLQQASLTGEPNEYIDLQKHDKMACEAPPPKTSLPSAVEVEVTLNGEDYTGDGVQFGYYLHPKIIGISPNRGSAAKTQLLTLTRRAATTRACGSRRSSSSAARTWGSRCAASRRWSSPRGGGRCSTARR